MVLSSTITFTCLKKIGALPVECFFCFFLGFRYTNESYRAWNDTTQEFVRLRFDPAAGNWTFPGEVVATLHSRQDQLRKQGAVDFDIIPPPAHCFAPNQQRRCYGSAAWCGLHHAA